MWHDFDSGQRDSDRSDPVEESAVESLRNFFNKNRESVFFGNQLAVRYEGKYFHWVTHRAAGQLIEEGLLKTETRELATGATIKLVWDRRYRYYRRDAKRVIELVNEYGSPNMCGAIGLHGEQMILGGFARRKFVLEGFQTREHEGKEWSESQHNLDFVFKRDDVAYGVEVKNTLSYMDLDELNLKLRLCKHIGVRPVFAVRMLPKTWINSIIAAGGYAMILKYQLYPWTHVELAKRVSKELGLPVDAPKQLADGTMDRFERWHGKNA